MLMINNVLDEPLQAGGAEKPAAAAEIASVNMPALRRAAEDLSASYPDSYGRKGYLARLGDFEEQLPQILSGLAAGRADAEQQAASLLAFRQEALLANPLLDFDKLLVVKRNIKGPAARGDPAVAPDGW